MKKHFSLIGKLFLILLLVFVCIQLSGFIDPLKSDKEEVIDHHYQEHMEEHYKVFSLPTPHHLTFCGQEVPLDKFGVREKLDRELLVNTYWHSNTFLSFKRSNRFFPTIERILAEENIPDDFKYLALVESGLTNAVSPAGARGYWQFMTETAKEFGLEVSHEVDERYNLELSTRAACQYLKDSFEVYGDWALVAASYNMGIGGLSKQLKRQKVNSYWDLLLNQETARYVYRILAMKEILNHSEAYGFVVRAKDLYEPHSTRKLEVDSAIGSWIDFAIDNGTTYNVLHTLNPWIKDERLLNKKRKSYDVLLPLKE